MYFYRVSTEIFFSKTLNNGINFIKFKIFPININMKIHKIMLSNNTSVLSLSQCDYGSWNYGPQNKTNDLLMRKIYMLAKF